MLNQLLGMPLMFFTALLPVMLLAAYLLKFFPARAYRWLAICGLAVLGSAAISLLVFALLYLGSPNFTDHIEPTTAVVAWLYSQGGQIYHAIDAPERYAFLYGPVPYTVTGWFYKIFGATTFSAKLAGFLCLLVSMLALGGAVRRALPQRFFPVIVALGYLALLALFFKNHSFWSKPDPFMIASVAVALYAATLRAGRAAWLICAVALGVAINAKVTGAVYFLPILAWFYSRDGWRSIMLVAPISVLIALLPFLFPQQISLANYISWLQSAGGHGLSTTLLIQNTLFLLFASLPVCIFLAWQRAMPDIRNLLAANKLVASASLLAVFLILIAASKPGSGPHHYLPFLPYFAFLVAYATDRVFTYQPETNWALYGFWVPASTFLIAAAVKSSFALYYGVKIVLYQASQEDVASDIAAILEEHSGSNIYMGYGDGSEYTNTFLRHQLAYAGQPYLLDAPAMMDFQASGLPIPAATIAALLDDQSAIWLIPKDQEPFMLVNWYYRNSGGLVFDEAFRSVFSDNFSREASTPYFDLYTRTNRNVEK